MIRLVPTTSLRVALRQLKGVGKSHRDRPNPATTCRAALSACRRRNARSSTVRIRLVPTNIVWAALCAPLRASDRFARAPAPMRRVALRSRTLHADCSHFRAGCFVLPPHALHAWLLAASCRACPGSLFGLAVAAGQGPAWQCWDKAHLLNMSRYDRPSQEQ